MPDPTHVRLHHQFVALVDMYLHAKNQLYTSKSFCDLLKAFLHLIREVDFSQTFGFNKIVTVIMMHDLNPKYLHINRLIFFQNLKNPIFGVFWGIIPRMFFPKNLVTSVF